MPAEKTVDMKIKRHPHGNIASETKKGIIGLKQVDSASFDSSSSDRGSITQGQATPKNLKTVFYKAHSNTGDSLTYGGQSKLPRLPIPTLDETLAKFVNVVAPLLDNETQKVTKKVVEQFRTDQGPEIQKALVEYDKAGFEAGTLGSYVEEFWNESYLSPDDSVVLNLNPFFVLEGGPDPKTASNQIARAASLSFAAIKMASLLKEEKLKPDFFKKKPLCMDQFRVLFASSRQPVSRHDTGACDDVHVYSESTHIVVLCKNQFYYFPVMWPDSYELALDEHDIRDMLAAIQKHAESLSPKATSKTGIGAFTALPRSKWAATREEMCLFEVNEKSLSVIDSALFVLVLDDFTPQDIHSCAANMLHGTSFQVDEGDDFQQQGTCLNRWYDKLQLIVCKDGTAGVNFEHSSIDGHTALRFVSDTYAETVLAFADSITSLIHGRGTLPHVIEATVKRAVDVRDGDGQLVLDVQPRKLLFELNENLQKDVYFAETTLCDQMVANDTHVLEFKDYGKSLIVGNSLSPDALVQMSILLAYFKLYGEVVCQYEPVLTKSFYHGRTEAMRSVTPKAKHLCEIWIATGTSTEDRLEALKEATQEHSRLCKESSQGKGVDRHLFALKCIAARKGMPTPPFFDSLAWKTLGHTILSTSNCGNPSLRLFGFGPVVPDGFGVGYIIKDNALSYSVASKHRQTSRYVRTLRTVLREIHSLLKPLSAVSVMDRANAPAAHTWSEAVDDSGYDDLYGETGIANDVPPIQKPLQSAKTDKSRNQPSRSRVFSIVSEQDEGVDLNDAPHEVVDL
mmetsp:Transcript_14156/g.33908  ORF Transcript_14156/g.33908 Transcript_14156/m.33908 type:complete len:795 (+) Transcript_14156:299-2683(+)